MCKIVQSCCLFFIQNKTTKASKRPFRGIKRARERAHIVSIHYTILQISKLLSGERVKLFQSWADLGAGLGVGTIRSHPLQPLWTPHEIYTTQFSWLCLRVQHCLLQIRVKHCFETGQVFLGLMLYLLKLFHLHPSNPSGLVVSMIYQVFWVVGSKPNGLSGQFFFLSKKLKGLALS